MKAVKLLKVSAVVAYYIFYPIWQSIMYVFLLGTGMIAYGVLVREE